MVIWFGQTRRVQNVQLLSPSELVSLSRVCHIFLAPVQILCGLYFSSKTQHLSTVDKS